MSFILEAVGFQTFLLKLIWRVLDEKNCSVKMKKAHPHQERETKTEVYRYKKDQILNVAIYIMSNWK